MRLALQLHSRKLRQTALPKKLKPKSKPKTKPQLSQKFRRALSRRYLRVARSKCGFGLFATHPIPKGRYIIPYTGRKLTTAQADALDTKYLFELNSRWTIDGSSRKNLARYINHSCRPNAETDIKQHRIFISAIKNIQPGDEITYNYGRDYFNAFIKERGCKCLACHAKKLVKRSAVKRSSVKRGKR
jgi:uncharacterized protein